MAWFWMRREDVDEHTFLYQLLPNQGYLGSAVCEFVDDPAAREGAWVVAIGESCWSDRPLRPDGECGEWSAETDQTDPAVLCPSREDALYRLALHRLLQEASA